MPSTSKSTKRRKNGNGNGNGLRQEREAVNFFMKMWGPAKVFGGAVLGVAAFVLSWNQLGFWKPASVDYVDQKTLVLSHKIDSVDASSLQNRVETLTASKNRDIGEKTDLDLKLKAAGPKSDDYVRMIQTRSAYLQDQIDSITNQIHGIQESIERRQHSSEATAASKAD